MPNLIQKNGEYYLEFTPEQYEDFQEIAKNYKASESTSKSTSKPQVFNDVGDFFDIDAYCGQGNNSFTGSKSSTSGALIRLPC
jgi:hypothetical protein